MINGKIVDTSVWINYLNNVIDDQTDITDSLIKKDEVFILPVIVQELLQGIREEKDFELTKTALLEFPFLPYYDVEMAVSAASLYRYLKTKGVTIRKPNDCLIAAICIKQEIPILHNDRDFDNIAKYTSLTIYK